jgi:glycosyltransferase involved in cell wall biosynthesis
VSIATIIWVVNESELITSSIEHALAIGVDQVMVCDLGSTDPTPDLVETLCGRFPVSLKRFSETDFADSAAWQKREVELLRETGADWVILQDADEFWIPNGGTLKDLPLPQDVDALSVARFNIVLTADQPPANEISLSVLARSSFFVKKVENFPARLDVDPGLFWSQGVPMPKLMVRPDRVVTLYMGWHGAEMLEGPARIANMPADRVFVAHLPFSTYSRFKKKVTSIRETLASQTQYYPGMIGWHWKRWLRLEEEGRLREEYRHQFIDNEIRAVLREQKAILECKDIFGGKLSGA